MASSTTRHGRSGHFFGTSSALAIALALGLTAGRALAATPLYWDPAGAASGTLPMPTGVWDLGTGNWSSSSSGGSGTTWVLTDDAYFTAGIYGTDAINPYVVTVGTSLSAAGVIDNMSGGLTITGNPATTLTLGTDGILMNASGGAMAIGSTNLQVTLGASQSWTNNSSNLLTVSGQVNLGGNTLTLGGTGQITSNNATFTNGTVRTSSGTTFTTTNTINVNGANIGNDAIARTITLAGGTLTMTAPLGPSIAVHWSGYYANTSDVTTTDGVVPNSHWNNLQGGWMQYTNTYNNGIVDSTSAAVNGMTVTANHAGNSGASGFNDFQYGASQGDSAGLPSENLLKGPGGPGPISSEITGIPYASYEIIAYANSRYGGNDQVWIDPNPSSASVNNVPSSKYYFNVIGTNDLGFIQVTNTNSTQAPQGDYMVFTGLSGANQVIWLTGPYSPGITSFEIVSTPGVNIPSSNIMVTSTSTLSPPANVPSTFGAASLASATLNVGNATSVTFSQGTIGSTAENVLSTGTSAVTLGTNPATGLATTFILAGTNIDVNGTLTLPAVTFSNSSAVTVNGNAGNTGTLVLSGTTTFNGAGPVTLTISAGTLQFNSGSSLSSTTLSTIHVLGGAALVGGISTGAAVTVEANGVISPLASGTTGVTTSDNLTLVAGSYYRWSYTGAGNYSTLNAGTLTLPASGAPIFQPAFTVAPPTLSNGNLVTPLTVATWTGAQPTNEPATWGFDGTLVPSSSTNGGWTGGTTGNFLDLSNWNALGYSGATITYDNVHKWVQLTGLTSGYGGTLPAINASTTLTIAPPSENVVVTGPPSATTITSLTISGAGPSTAEVDLQPAGSLTASDNLTLNASGTLRTAGANLGSAGTPIPTINSAGTLSVNTSSTVTAATLNVLGGTATFADGTTTTVTNLNVSGGAAAFSNILTENGNVVLTAANVTVSGSGQLSVWSSSATIGTLTVTGTGGTGVSIDGYGTFITGASNLSGGTTEFTIPNVGPVNVSGTASVHFSGLLGPLTTITGGLTVAGNGSVTFDKNTSTSATNVDTLTVTGGSVSLGDAEVTTANLSGGTTTLDTGITGILGIGANSLNLSGAANLTANGGALGPMTFAASYTGTTTINASATTPAAVTVAAGTGIVNLNNALTTLTVGGSTVNRTGNTTTITQTGGTLTVTGNITGTATVSGTGNFTLSTGYSAGAINQSGGTVTLADNTTVTTVTLSGGTFVPQPTTGTIANLNLGSTFTGSVTIPAGVAVTNAAVAGGTATFNSPLTSLTTATGGTANNVTMAAGGTLTSTGGTVTFATAPSVNTAGLVGGTISLPSPGSVLSVANQFSTNAGTFAWTGATAFSVGGTNIADDTQARTLTLTGGTLTASGNPASVAVHWTGYGGNSHTSDVTGIAGVVPNGHWTNVAVNWYGLGSNNNANLVNSTGVATSAAVTCVAAVCGTYWKDYPAPAYPAVTNNVLRGAGGGNGGDPGHGASSALPTVITGIPFANYEIIEYVNDFEAGGTLQTWLDPTPATPSATNAPIGTSYYFAPTGGNVNSLVQISNTNSAQTPMPAGNYVVFGGLSGPSQAVWLNGFAGGIANYGQTSIEIVDTAPPNLTVPQTAISVTATSTLSIPNTATLGNVRLSNSSTLTLTAATSMTFGSVAATGVSAIALDPASPPQLILAGATIDATAAADQLTLPAVSLAPAGGTLTVNGSGVGKVFFGGATTVAAGTNLIVTGGTFGIGSGSTPATMTVSGPGTTLTINAAQSHVAGSQLNLGAGTITTMNTDAGSAGSLNLAISISGAAASLTFGTAGTALSEHLASLTLGSGATVTLADGGTPTGGGVTLTTGKVLVTGALAFAGNGLVGYGGQLNLMNNAMVLKGAAGAYNAGQTQLNVDLVLGLLASGYDGGLWDGQGLISSTAASNKDHLAVGYATGHELDPTDTGQFQIDGVTLGANDVVVSFTKPGDYAMVGGTSFPAIADVLGHEGTNQDWYNGGFTYGVLDHTSGMVQYDANNNPIPGAVSFPDFVAVLNNIGNHFGDAQEVTPVVPSVPEPASLGLLAAGALALFRGRGRRNRHAR